MAIMRRSILRTLPTAIAACIVATAGSIAAAQDVPLSTCFDAVGTYLTENVATTGGASTDMGRSLLSLTNGGHAFLIDSNERGIDEFAPFSDGLGAWRCLSEDAGTLQLRVTVLDFTFATGTSGPADRPAGHTGNLRHRDRDA